MLQSVSPVSTRSKRSFGTASARPSALTAPGSNGESPMPPAPILSTATSLSRPPPARYPPAEAYSGSFGVPAPAEGGPARGDRPCNPPFSGRYVTRPPPASGSTLRDPDPQTDRDLVGVRYPGVGLPD